MLSKYMVSKRVAGRTSFRVYGLAVALFVLVATPTVRPTCGGQTSSSPRAPSILEATRFSGSLVGVQYETWFTPGNAGSWKTTEAVPVLGKYNSFDANVLRKHEEWFEDLGVNWLLLDWSNMLWTKPEWEEHQGASHELEESTLLLFKTYSKLETEGKHPPKLVLMIGLQNGPLVPHAVQRLNGIIAWTKTNFLDKPEFKDLWLYYHGKPLLVILFFTSNPCVDVRQLTSDTPLEARDWTVRWMASQLQDNHADRCGMWSWMDGPIRQIVTYNQAIPEESVVTPASFPFPGKGWLHPAAVGRDHGSPYLQSWGVAFESRPKFIQIHQWNEFAGQMEGQGFSANYWESPAEMSSTGQRPSNIYADEYNLEFSDDIEPVQMDKCAYRGCGGWGYYYLNLTEAILSLYRGATPDITVMTLSGPAQPAVVKEKEIVLKWEVLGKKPSTFTVQLDGKVVADHIQGPSYPLNLTQVPAGKHRVTVIADGAHTYFDLSPVKLASRSSKPLPVASTIEFTCAADGGRK